MQPWTDDDIVGPDEAVAPGAFLDRARSLAARFDVDADEVAVRGVTRDRLDRAASTGLVAPYASATGPTSAQQREAVELVAAACPSTWFVLTQHRSAWEAATTTGNAALRERWAEPLSTGAALGAVAFAHLRRTGPAPVTAQRTPADRSWRVDGTLDWITGWGLTDVLCLMVRADDDVLTTLIPAQERPGLVVTPPLDLLAMGGTATVAATLRGLRVDEDEIASREPFVQWQRRDQERTANCVPAVFGATRAAIDALAQAAQARRDAEAVALVASLAEQVRRVRREAYALIDEVPADEQLERRVELRARSLLLLARATDALVVVSGGRALSAQTRAARWSREARFFLVQAQTAPLRAALLNGLRSPQ